ncbi:MAG: hypothetical protein JXC32_10025 [Anaerolineae bacterium]|nr:hypothetical protein [Anaerolineae bacterium]
MQKTLPNLISDVLHASNNTTPQFLIPGFIEQLPIFIFAAVVLIRDRMWAKTGEKGG